MRLHCCLSHFLAWLLIFFIFDCTHAATTVAAKSKVSYDSPARYSPREELISKFKAVSSHGRSDETDKANAVVYSSFQITVRAFYLLLVFAPVLSTSWLAFISSWYRSVIWYKLLRFGISQGGAAFIKWAQWASTRPDIFPEDLCSILASLQTGAPEHSFAFTNRQVHKELGAPIDQIFESFSKKPIASGSIAQVYKGKLNGEDVAVKVRHPNVEEQIGMDFIIMKWLATIVDRTRGLEWLKLSETLSQFSATIASQTDLEAEGRHLYLFNHYFKKWSTVSFPKPIILTGSILVESFEFGESVDKYTKTISCDIKQPPARESAANVKSGRKQNGIRLPELIKNCNLAHFIVTAGEDTYLKMLLQDNLMHADLHPGNIIIQHYNTDRTQQQNKVDSMLLASAKESETLITPTTSFNPALPSSTRIVLVDAGMVARLVPEEQKNFIGLLEAMGEGRGDEAATHVMKFSQNPKYSEATKTAFKKDMKNFFSADCKGYGNNVDIGVALRGILNLVRIHKITIDANYATLVMNCLCLDGMARALLPTYNILDGAKPLLRFNRIFKKIPGSFFILKAVIPIAQWLKRKNDQNFLDKLRDGLLKLSD